MFGCVWLGVGFVAGGGSLPWLEGFHAVREGGGLSQSAVRPYVITACSVYFQGPSRKLFEVPELDVSQDFDSTSDKINAMLLATSMEEMDTENQGEDGEINKETDDIGQTEENGAEDNEENPKDEMERTSKRKRTKGTTEMTTDVTNDGGQRTIEEISETAKEELVQRANEGTTVTAKDTSGGGDISDEMLERTKADSPETDTSCAGDELGERTTEETTKTGRNTPGAGCSKDELFGTTTEDNKEPDTEADLSTSQCSDICDILKTPPSWSGLANRAAPRGVKKRKAPNDDLLSSLLRDSPGCVLSPLSRFITDNTACPDSEITFKTPVVKGPGTTERFLVDSPPSEAHASNLDAELLENCDEAMEDPTTIHQPVHETEMLRTSTPLVMKRISDLEIDVTPIRKSSRVSPAPSREFPETPSDSVDTPVIATEMDENTEVPFLRRRKGKRFSYPTSSQIKNTYPERLNNLPTELAQNVVIGQNQQANFAPNSTSVTMETLNTPKAQPVQDGRALGGGHPLGVLTGVDGLAKSLLEETNTNTPKRRPHRASYNSGLWLFLGRAKLSAGTAFGVVYVSDTP